MILVIEIDKKSNFSKQALAFELLFTRLAYKVGCHRIHQYSNDDAYDALKENDKKPDDWFIIFFDKIKAPLSVRRACDNRCVLTDEGIIWMRKKTLEVFENIGKLYTPKKDRIGEVDKR